MKKPKELEKIIKGCANQRRIDTLALLKKEPGLTLEQISAELGINFRTASERLRRMTLGGLVMKRYEGNRGASRFERAREDRFGVFAVTGMTFGWVVHSNIPQNIGIDK